MIRALLHCCLAFAAFFLAACGKEPDAQIVKVGVLHSQSGTMASSEKHLIDAVNLAIREINESNYLPGLRLEPIVRDGASRENAFATEAENLLAKEDVAVIFGGWTSASRKAMIPVLEANHGLLFYPVQYEGAESNPHIVYTGAAPNQQIIPAVYWAMKDKGAKTFYLVGSDFVFPRTANEVIKDQLKALGGEVVGERYLPLGATAFDEIAQDIATRQPDFILNTITGDSNKAFFRALRAAGIQSEDTPTLSFSLDEALLKDMAKRDLIGDYAAWNYFQSIDTEDNHRFVKSIQEDYGADQVTTDPMEAAYSAVYLWAEAVKKAGRREARLTLEHASPESVRDHIGNRSFQAPWGMVFIDPQNQHLYKTARIGRIQHDGQFTIEWESDMPVRPAPYPIFRPIEAWDEHLAMLKQGWNGQWSAPTE